MRVIGTVVGYCRRFASTMLQSPEAVRHLACARILAIGVKVRHIYTSKDIEQRLGEKARTQGRARLQQGGVWGVLEWLE